MENLLKRKTTLFIVFLIVIGSFFRFSNLNWGAPYYFHPDERNIASSIVQLLFPSNMNPNFFAYGSLPIYSIYFLGIIQNFFLHKALLTVDFSQAIIIGRFYSACLSVLLIPLLYLVGKTLQGRLTGIFSAVLATTSIGFIQYAHFATFEIWLSFFSTLLFYFCLVYLKNPTKKILILQGITFGVLCSIKISSLILSLPILFLLIYSTLVLKKQFFSSIKLLLVTSAILFSFALIVYIISNPFVFFTPSAFLSSMEYESSVVLNTLPVFYTQGFVHTIPIQYQLFHIFPFILNPVILGFFLFSLPYFFYKAVQKKSFSFFLLIPFLLIIFLSQAFFFAKWTRYMIPTLPFIYCIMAITCADLFGLAQQKKIFKRITICILSLVLGVSTFYASYFVYHVYYQQDSRIAANAWAIRHISSQAAILSEVYDLGIIPFNTTHANITLFNFYDLDIDDVQKNNLYRLLDKTDVIILPSQRIIKPRLLNRKDFPKGFHFYNNLISENGYKKIYETPCDFFCKILYMGNPVFSLEETTNIFDRPTIYIFQQI